jgi:hydroxymethylbilane synthase
MKQLRPFIVGTRGSGLAIRQTEQVTNMLRVLRPGVDITMREIKTEGDRRPEESLATIGGQGVFVKEIEAALLRKEIDFAVHSMKDVPADLADGYIIAAVPERDDPRDVLVTHDRAKLADLPPGARIGTGSARRAVQLRALRADIEALDIRGNVDTRIRKVDDGEYDAVVLALAGLLRLEVTARASQIFTPDEMLPAVGQGALAVEARGDDAEVLDLLAEIEDVDARRCVEAERAFLQQLGGGCRLPFGALAELDGGDLRLRGFITDDGGEQMFRSELRGAVDEGTALGRRLADDLLGMKASFDIPSTGP